MKYKGFKGQTKYSVKDKCYYGKILGITDLVNYEAYNKEELEKEFKNAVDKYLELCKELKK